MLAAFDNSKMGNKNVMSGVATINSTFSSICSKMPNTLTLMISLTV